MREASKLYREFIGAPLTRRETDGNFSSLPNLLDPPRWGDEEAKELQSFFVAHEEPPKTLIELTRSSAICMIFSSSRNRGSRYDLVTLLNLAASKSLPSHLSTKRSRMSTFFRLKYIVLCIYFNFYHGNRYTSHTRK